MNDYTELDQPPSLILNPPSACSREGLLWSQAKQQKGCRVVVGTPLGFEFSATQLKGKCEKLFKVDLSTQGGGARKGL